MAYTASAPSEPRLPIATRLTLHPTHSQAFAPPHMQNMTRHLCAAKGITVPNMNYHDTVTVGNYLLANFSVAEIEMANEYLKSEYAMRKSRNPYARKPRSVPSSTLGANEITPQEPIAPTPAQMPTPSVDMRDYVRKQYYNANMEIITEKIRQSSNKIDCLNDAVGMAIDELRQELRNSKPLVIEIKRPDIPAP